MPKTLRNQNVPAQNGSLFYTDLEDRFFLNIADELYNSVVQSFILYYQIDEKRSQINETTGETEITIFRNPFKIGCFVEEEEPTVEYNAAGISKSQLITCWIHKREMEIKGVKIMAGDYIEWNGLSYLIVSSIDTRHLHGVSKFRDTIKVQAVLPDKGKFGNI